MAVRPAVAAPTAGARYVAWVASGSACVTCCRLADKRNHIGIRIPNHPIALKIVEALDTPLTVTSALSLENDEILKNPWEIEQEFGNQLEAIIDAGEVENLDFSSVIDLTNDEIVVVREGLGDVSPFLD